MKRRLMLFVVVQLLGYTSIEGFQSEEFFKYKAILSEAGSRFSLLSTDLKEALILPYIVKGLKPLDFAIGLGLLSMCNALIAAGADINKTNDQGVTPLVYAATCGHQAIVSRLLAAGADKNKSTKYKKTPLFCAATQGDDAIVALLLAADADPNIADTNGLTPLLCAVMNDYFSIVDKLLTAGANVDKTDNQGVTPLQRAIYVLGSGNFDLNVFDRLMAARPLVDKADKKGRTPLMLAVCNNRADLVGRLLRAGADKNKPDNRGKTALDEANDWGFEGVRTSLERHVAEL